MSRGQTRVYAPGPGPARTLRALAVLHRGLTGLAQGVFPRAQVWRFTTERGVAWVLRRPEVDDVELSAPVLTRAMGGAGELGDGYARARWALGVLIAAERKRLLARAGGGDENPPV